jgi:DNA polymerase-3 subunit epsilon
MTADTEDTEGKLVFFDSETTGLHPDEGDRIVEVGFVECINRQLTGRRLHLYFDPQRDVPEEAFEVHGHSRDDLVRKSKGRVFANGAQEIIDFIQGATLIAHNAKFDEKFFDKEFEIAGYKPLAAHCAGIIDSLKIAHAKFPGQRNSLDALLNRLVGKDNYKRESHGALLDSELLAQVYFLMTIKQEGLQLDSRLHEGGLSLNPQRLDLNPGDLVVANVADVDRARHEAMQQRIRKSSGGSCIDFSF